MPTLRVSLDGAVTAMFPEVQIRLLLAVGFDNHGPWDDVSAALSDLEARVQSGEWIPMKEEDPEIQVWHGAYRRFGTNPRKFRPSLDALSRRLARRGVLPRVSPVVDAYNLVSVTHGVPAGAFDVRGLGHYVTIRQSQPDDRFTPLGEPEEVEIPQPGEIVYADGHRVLTRHWNYRDADSTKVTNATTEALFCLDRAFLRPLSDDRMAEAAYALSRLLEPRAASVVGGVLDAAHTEAAFSW